MMPKHSSRAPWGRRFTAMIAVSLLTLGACSDSDGGGVGPSTIATVGIVTLPNNQTLTNLTPGDKRKMLGVPTNSKGNFIDKTVTLASSNPAVFTLAGDSVVAVAGGTAYLRATSGGRTDSVAIGVRFRVAAIAITPAAPTIRREAAQALTAVQRDANPAVAGGAVVTGRPLTWTSSVPAVATVSATGVVSATATAIDGSTTVITATAPNTLDGGVATVATVTVTVSGNAVVSSVLVTGGTGVDAIGFRGNVGTLQLTGVARSGLLNPTGSPITWTTNAATVATVDAAGLVTFVGASGPVTITGTAVGAGAAAANVAGTAAFTVAPTLINGVTVVGAMAAGAGVDFAFSADRVGATTFTATTSGGSGDGDLYVFGVGVTNGTASDAGGTNFLCRSWNSGNGESCPISPVVPGWYRLRLHAWTPAGAVAGMNLTLTHP